MTPKISVIIPFYKNAATIGRALLSVENQEYPELEVLLINDASPDWKQAKEILTSFLDLQIKVIHHQENRNGSAARNTGIKSASGDFLAFLDADDEWLPNHLEKSLKKIIDSKSDFVYSKCLIKSKYADLILPDRPLLKVEKISSYLFTSGQAIYTPSFFVDKKVFDLVNFDETLIRHQDYDLLLRLENENYTIAFSNHVGTIVHWENTDPVGKGENWKYSLQWVLDRKKYFTQAAFDNFIVQFVILKMIKNNQKGKALKLFLVQKINPFYLSNRNIYNLIVSFFK